MLNVIILILSFRITLIAFHGLFLLSEKQLKKTQNSRFAWLLNQPKGYKITCFAMCFIAGLLLMIIYGGSVGFVVWWLFATPLVLTVILKVNNLHKPSK